MRKKIILFIFICSIILCGCNIQETFQNIDGSLRKDTIEFAEVVNEYSTDINEQMSSLTESISSSLSNNETISDSKTNDFPLEIHFIDVGQGDSTLIICNNEAMLIDAGDNTKGTLIQNYLTKRGISTLKYVVGTHPDADHYGGLDVIITKFNCETIFLPHYEKDTLSYNEVMDAITYKGYTVTDPCVGTTYSLGDAEFTILGPVTYNYGEECNNYSIILKLEYGDTSFLFTGDAEELAETDMINSGYDLSADVYKAGHHGSSSSSSRDFMNKVNPSYVVISCGIDNDYGHPHSEPLNRFRKIGAQVFRTDEQGSIIAYSDGKNVSWNCSPSDSWKSYKN